MKVNYKHMGAEATRDGVKFWGYMETEEGKMINMYYMIDHELYCDLIAEFEGDEDLTDRAVIGLAILKKGYSDYTIDMNPQKIHEITEEEWNEYEEQRRRDQQYHAMQEVINECYKIMGL